MRSVSTRSRKSLVELTTRISFVPARSFPNPDKTKLRELNQEESKLTTDFGNQLLAATKAGALVLDDVIRARRIQPGRDCDCGRGCEAARIHRQVGDSASEHNAASCSGSSSRIERFASDCSWRRRLAPRRVTANDTRDIVKRLAQLRGDKAKLLGFPNYSAYALDNQMAKTPENATKLLTDLVPAATAKRTAKMRSMQALIDQQGGGFKLAPWDWQYYAEQVRKAQYALDEAQLKPYFELNSVLQNGVFYAANKLYGLTFKERKDIPGLSA